MNRFGGYGKARLDESIAAFRDGIKAIEDATRAARRTATTESGRTLAVFGQWVEPAPASQSGQYGLTGTAAAMSVLARPPFFGDRGEVAALLRESLEFLLWRTTRPNPQRIAKTNLVLRQTQILNAAAAVHLWNAGHAEPRVSQAELERVVATSRRVLREALDRVELAAGTSVAGVNQVSGFRIGSTAQAAPQPATVWAFHLASVIDAVCFAGRCNVLTDKQMAKLLKPEAVDQLASWTIEALRERHQVDERVALFAGWALLAMGNLECEAAPLDSYPAVESAAPSSDQREKLAAELAKSTRRILKKRGRRADLHHPYDYSVVDEAGTVKYFADHFVVATVPLALSTSARLSQQNLFSSGVRRNLKETLQAVTTSTRPQVVPEQFTHRNGTVNYMYARQALVEMIYLAERARDRGLAWQVTTRVRTARGALWAWITSGWGFVQTPAGFLFGSLLGGLLGSGAYDLCRRLVGPLF